MLNRWEGSGNQPLANDVNDERMVVYLPTYIPILAQPTIIAGLLRTEAVHRARRLQYPWLDETKNIDAGPIQSWLLYPITGTWMRGFIFGELKIISGV
jgi:hypothetical protein